MQTSTSVFGKRCGGLLGLLFLFLLLSAPKAQAQTWLVSTDPFVKIGVSDKFGQLGAYTAKFTVSGNGKEYSLVKQVDKGQNGVDVLFPSPPTEAEFFQTPAGIAANASPGNYTWQCEVNGKKVAGGRFVMPTVANDVTVVERNR
ncbi:hypothetical protein [Hymenobacter jeollabukensis]|uniref:Uncharacterized protein n=1 Tax=Hymenobacter jeollabukensis TaxID=2025313 RepID=A0A5R8WKX0_9BACT|nr:hypothetical protein [Hymenobacter jeollabukensis]TLM89396.1 hypothetical protein FDY95_20195 [Hymenobacter jeollabukensis]